MVDSLDPRKAASRTPLQVAFGLLVVSALSFVWLVPMERDHTGALGGAAGSLVLGALIMFVRAPWVKSLATLAVVAVAGFLAMWVASKGVSFVFREGQGFHYAQVTYVLIANVVIASVVRYLLQSPSLAFHFASDAERAAIESSREGP